eukprot:EG_transcript_9591
MHRPGWPDRASESLSGPRSAAARTVPHRLPADAALTARARPHITKPGFPLSPAFRADALCAGVSPKSFSGDRPQPLSPLKARPGPLRAGSPHAGPAGLGSSTRSTRTVGPHHLAASAGPGELPLEALSVEVRTQIDLFEERLQNFQFFPTSSLSSANTAIISDEKTLTSNGSRRMETQTSSVVAKLFQLQMLQSNRILQKARGMDRAVLVATYQSHCCEGAQRLSQFHRMWQELLGKEADWRSAEMIFNLCDKNANGNVSLKEFLNTTDLLLLHQEDETVLQYFFHLLCGKGRYNTFVTKFDVNAILTAFESLQLPGRATRRQQEVELKAAVLRRRLDQLPWEADSRLELRAFQEGIQQDPILCAAFIRQTPEPVPESAASRPTDSGGSPRVAGQCSPEASPRPTPTD